MIGLLFEQRIIEIAAKRVVPIYTRVSRVVPLIIISWQKTQQLCGREATNISDISVREEKTLIISKPFAVSHKKQSNR